MSNLKSEALRRLLELAPPSTIDLVVDRDLRVPMRDGAALLADRWAPRTGGTGLPTAVVRCPYGRAGLIADVTARPLAERGFQVLIQSTRGTFGSDGPFDPLRREREDGLDTLDWVIGQPWFGDSIVLVGGSYSGVVQWAVADQAPPQVKAMIPAVTESALTLEFLRRDGFSLEVPFVWGVQVDGQERPFAMLRGLARARRVQRALRALPLSRADQVALGHRSDYIQKVLAHDRDDPFWAAADHRATVAEVTVPASLIAGWYDIFLPGQLRDFAALQGAGRTARLTVGPWHHTDARAANSLITSEALGFGLPLARGEQPPDRAPVRLYVTGADTWHEFPSWPPPGYRPQRFHLHTGGRLDTAAPDESDPDRYRYDPADPTPAVGGVRMALGEKAGPVDNARLEARPDVLTYTTDVLPQSVEVIGDVTAEIYFRSSLAHADVFVRLCDVDEQGRSTNVCDELVSLDAADLTTRATVRLWPTAHRFAAGHRIRVQVSSGAFPRFNRNPGTGEPRAAAITLLAADQQVLHDPEHASAVVLPVRGSDQGPPDPDQD